MPEHNSPVFCIHNLQKLDDLFMVLELKVGHRQVVDVQSTLNSSMRTVAETAFVMRELIPPYDASPRPRGEFSIHDVCQVDEDTMSFLCMWTNPLDQDDITALANGYCHIDEPVVRLFECIATAFKESKHSGILSHEFQFGPARTHLNTELQ